jgi:hypothetical protein
MITLGLTLTTPALAAPATPDPAEADGYFKLKRYNADGFESAARLDYCKQLNTYCSNWRRNLSATDDNCKAPHCECEYISTQIVYQNCGKVKRGNSTDSTSGEESANC